MLWARDPACLEALLSAGANPNATRGLMPTGPALAEVEFFPGKKEDEYRDDNQNTRGTMLQLRTRSF
jgi:hypothetical protein